MQRRVASTWSSCGRPAAAPRRQRGRADFGIACSSNGWFIEKHAKLDPISTMTEGVFVAGCAQGPKDIPASVSQGAAAAARC